MTEQQRLIDTYLTDFVGKVWYFCRKRTGTDDEAGQLASDISLNVLTALNAGTVPRHFPAWVWRIARNRYAAWAEEKRFRRENETDTDLSGLDLPDPDADPEEKAVLAEQLALLRRELSFLASEYRHVVCAYYLRNESVSVIAGALGVPVGTVTSRLTRARKMLKEGIEMAREFGKMSYDPENVKFSMSGLHGTDGSPWKYLTRLLDKNILLAAYRSPSTAEELAVELGVALPYMEEELASLSAATLLRRRGKKYEPTFFIVSAEAQEKINAHVRKIAPLLTAALREVYEAEHEWRRLNCPGWCESAQSPEDMRFAGIMRLTDNAEDCARMKTNRRPPLTPASAEVGTFGHTKRPCGGEWDILGYENNSGDEPMFVSLYGCVADASEAELPDIEFRHFTFQNLGRYYFNPELNYRAGQALVRIAEGEAGAVDPVTAERLRSGCYLLPGTEKPSLAFPVYRKARSGELPLPVQRQADGARFCAEKLASDHYDYCRALLEKEIPAFLKDDTYQIDQACANVFTLRGAVVEEALKTGFLVFPQEDSRLRMLGAYLIL